MPLIYPRDYWKNKGLLVRQIEVIAIKVLLPKLSKLKEIKVLFSLLEVKVKMQKPLPSGFSVKKEIFAFVGIVLLYTLP